MTTAFSRITKIGGVILPLIAFVICKTEPYNCFSCKIDVCGLSPFYKTGVIFQGVVQTMRVRLKLNFGLCVFVNVGGLMRLTSLIS